MGGFGLWVRGSKRSNRKKVFIRKNNVKLLHNVSKSSWQKSPFYFISIRRISRKLSLFPHATCASTFKPPPFSRHSDVTMVTGRVLLKRGYWSGAYDEPVSNGPPWIFHAMVAILNSKMADCICPLWPISSMLSGIGAYNQRLYLGFGGRSVRLYHQIFCPMAAILDFKMADSIYLFWTIFRILLNVNGQFKRLYLLFWGRPIRSCQHMMAAMLNSKMAAIHTSVESNIVATGW